mmetsp:Transcript_40277/g.96540  ORF Transcript_40277/g.96540 Transcript_40277/m.96540 type:complete len:230 (+) Transcript_40277:822-1511(+)
MPTITQSTALSMSTSSNTTMAPLPPSSMDAGISLFAAASNTFWPTGPLPVKDNRCTSLWSRSDCPASRPVPGTMLSAPGGRPASSARSPSRRHVAGHSVDGFSTIEHPAASPGATFTAAWRRGKFQGVTAPITPTGSLRMFPVNAGSPSFSGTVPPCAPVSSSSSPSFAKYSKISAHASMSARASVMGLPLSMVSRMAKSSRLSRRPCPILRTISARYLPVVALPQLLL